MTQIINVPIPDVVKFNWEILKEYTQSDPRKMLEFFDNVYVKKTDGYFRLNPWAATIISRSADSRMNYIQNIKDVINASKACTDSEIYVYLHLASKRSYFTFINSRGKSNYLPLWKIDEYDVEALTMNRLLTLDENNCYLLYENSNT